MPKDLVIAKRKYTDKDGQEKTEWLTVGVMMEATADKRAYILLDAGVNLAAYKQEGKGSVLVSIFERKPKDGQGGGTQSAAPAKAPAPKQDAPFDDEIPF